MFNVCGTFPQDLANVIKNFQKTVHIFFRLQNYCSIVPKYGAFAKNSSARIQKYYATHINKNTYFCMLFVNMRI